MTNGMTFDLGHLFFGGVIYLLLLFLIAYSAEQGWLPNRLVHHPVTYVLSLGVYATAWSFYGSVGFAQREGYLFATIYLGVTLAFLLAPVLLAPILRLIRDYQLTSLADLFAFRYRSQVAGILVTLFMLAGTLPYIALQIRAVTESVQVLTQEATPATLALGFCVTVTLFAILFGARHISPREKHEDSSSRSPSSRSSSSRRCSASDCTRCSGCLAAWTAWISGWRSTRSSWRPSIGRCRTAPGLPCCCWRSRPRFCCRASST